MAWIVAAEAAGIQDWIVGRATELRVIRGGSLLLDEAFARAERQTAEALGCEPDSPDAGVPIQGWCVVGRTSGQLTAVVADAGDADAAVETIRRVLREHLVGLNVAVGAAEWTDAPTGYVEARRAALGESGAHGPRVADYVLGSHTCEACGSATAVDDPVGPDGWLLCRGCRDRAALTGEATSPVDGAKITYRMDEIGAATAAARWQRYVAVIRADGNSIGRRFDEIADMPQAARLSREVQRAVDSAWQTALDGAVTAHQRVGDSNLLPVNPVIVAGDDLAIVVPAHVGVRTAATLTAPAGQHHAGNDPPSAFRACAGVLICHQTLPFNVAVDTAEGLLDAAKRAAREIDPARPPAYLAWAAESGGRPREGLGSHRLTVSPSPVAAVEALLQAAERFAAPTSAVRNVAAELDRGGRLAKRSWELFVRGRAVTEQDRGVLQSLWQTLAGDAGVDLATTPWPKPLSGEDVDAGRNPLGDLQLLRSLQTTDNDGDAV